MKVLVLTMTCGNGHNSVANSIKDSFIKQGVDCEVFNIFEENEGLKNANNNAYSFACNHIPHLYDFVWNLQRKRNPNKRYTGLGTYFIKKALDSNSNIINKFNPDVIICTHIYASNIACNLKRSKRIGEKIKIFTILLDYCVCPYFEDSILVDGVFTPNKITHEELISRGYKEEQLYDFGYPINNKFYKTQNKDELIQKLNINKNNLVILCLNGGNGLGDASKLVKTLTKLKLKNTTIINICGNNKRLKEKIDKYLTKKQIKNVQNYGFVDNVEEFMAVADVLFTRAGCTALNESMQMGIVPIIREQTQCNEKINKNVFLAKNMCYAMNKISDAKKIIESIISNKADLEIKKENLKNFNNPFGINKITEFIIKNNK